MSMKEGNDRTRWAFWHKGRVGRDATDGAAQS